jgi:hypothetical protein
MPEPSAAFVRPPDSFWREVPCGHPPDPVAWVNPDGSAICHCGWQLARGEAHIRFDDSQIVSCGKCGCYVAIEQGLV